MSENMFQSQAFNPSKTDYRLTLQQPSNTQMIVQDDILNQYKTNLKSSTFNQTSNDRHQLSQLQLEMDPKVQEIFLTMRMKSGETEDRNEQMKLGIITSYSKKQTIQIQLTSPKDPLVLYTLDMGEIEFHQLKNEQSLLIDFQNFPNFLMKMFELCLNDSNQTYLCVLHKRNATEALLIIQERTQFRELNHLILNLQQANDSLLKKYLGSLSVEYKSKFEAACESIEKLNGDISIAENENKQLKDQLQKEKVLTKSTLDNLVNEKNKELNQLKENCFSESKNKLDELEGGKNRKIQELDSKIMDIQKRYEDLLNEKKQVDEFKMKLEMKYKDLEGKYAISNTELNVYKDDITNLRQDNSALNQRCFKQEKEITEHKFMNDTFQKQIEEKEKNIINLNQLVDTLTKQSESNEDNIKGFKAANNKLEEKLQTSINEINKGNSIIEKLQAEVKAQKAKSKGKQQALTTQEELTTQKQMLLDEQIRVVNELKRTKESREMEIMGLNKQISNYQHKLQENEKLIEENKNMIMYLNQKLNDNYNPFQSPFQGGNTNNLQSTMMKQQMGINSGLNNPNFTNYSSEPLNTSNNMNNNNNMQSSTGSGMLIMPETNFCNYKPNNKLDNKYMNNTAHSSTGVNLLNHKYGMMTTSLSNKNLEGSGGSGMSMAFRNDESNSNVNIPNQRTYQMEEEFPRQMTQPQRTIYQNK